MRPGIVHRLDKEASGLMVIARTQKMFNHLKEQFKNRTIAKEYLALVHEPMARDWDEIIFPIARSETSDRMAARPLSVAQTTATPPSPPLGKGRRTISPSFQEGAGRVAEGEKEAKTEFTVEKNYVNCPLRVKPHRMHQIRVHLWLTPPHRGRSALLAKNKSEIGMKNWDGYFYILPKWALLDLDGNRQTFESPLPKELDEFLTLLKFKLSLRAKRSNPTVLVVPDNGIATSLRLLAMTYNTMSQGLLIIISLPPAAKRRDARLLKMFQSATRLVTTTSRPPRPTDKEVSLIILSPSDFEEKN